MGLEDVIEDRVGKKDHGLWSGTSKQKEGAIWENCLGRFFLRTAKYGLIWEFIGRVPVVVSLDALSEEMLVSILTQPKNSLVKQYKQLFELDGVDISFEKEALKEIAHEAMGKEHRCPRSAPTLWNRL